MTWTSSTPVIVGEPTKKTDVDKVFDNTLFLAGGVHHNLKLARGATAEILWVYAQSTGALPGATSPIGVLIPDGDELQIRQRTAAYLSGAGSFTLADAAGYWGRASLDASIYLGHLYAIWDGTGIVWALGGHGGMNRVSESAVTTDADYLLLEDSSTYVKDDSHFCISIASFQYEYDTGDAPDHTIDADYFMIDSPHPNLAEQGLTKTAGNYAITGGWTNIDTTNLMAFLPGPGTYLIIANLWILLELPDDSNYTAYARLYNNTAAAAITNSERMILEFDFDVASHWTAFGFGWSASWIVTVSAASVIYLQAIRNAGTYSVAVSATGGYCSMQFVKLHR